MRLKCIKLAGFKSFVDATTVNFPGSLCAVVGPNGCGKSNIIDAVRWVMGESSAKHLRGESMADVIFSGSGGRKPVAQASIELVFDNSDGTLAGEYAGYAEIAIKRKVTRDGQSMYFLNGSKCRRRDVTDVFLGTGLGPRSYAIIEQGMISNLIESKPDELRVYIEEAAGISKYKERRRDTENRIRRTRENLERLTDIRDELGRQLQRLERQAAAAEKYKVLKREERLLSAQYLALNWRDYHRSSEQQQSVIRDEATKMEALVAERTGVEAGIERLRVDYTANSDALSSVQETFYAVGAEISSLEQSIKHAQDRARELQSDMEQTEHNLSESSRHLEGDRDKIATWEAELKEVAPALTAARQASEQATTALQSAEQNTQNLQKEWDEFNRTAGEISRRVEVDQARIQHLELAIQRLGERMATYDAELSELNDSEPGLELNTLTEQLGNNEVQVEQCRAELVTVSETITKTRHQQVEIATTLNEARAALQTQQGRKAALEALQESALQDSGGVSDWLGEHKLNENQRLADELTVDTGWERAVETVLGADLQAVCVESLQRLESIGLDKADLQSGRVCIVESGTARSTGVAGLTPLASKVSGSRTYVESLFDGIYIADSLDQAWAKRSHLSAGESIITADGIWLGANWLRLIRDEEAAAGVLARKRELEQLSQEVTQAQGHIETLEARQAQVEQAQAEAESKRAQLDNGLSEFQRAYAEVRSRLSAERAKFTELEARRARLLKDVEGARTLKQQETEQLAAARTVLETAVEQMQSDESQRRELQQRREQLQQELETARAKARGDREQLHELDLRERALNTQLSTAREGLARLEVQVERLKERRTNLDQNRQQQADPSVELQANLQERLTVRLDIDKQLASARKAMEATEFNLRTEENKRLEIEKRTQILREGLEQLRLKAQEAATRAGAVVEQIEEKNYVLDDLLAELGEDADPADWQEQLAQMDRRIQRLGAINLAAVEEFQQASERKVYLDTQNAELNDALETLEGAIRKIDKETRTRFKETFEQVNTSLKQLFPKLFGGGHAYLELTGDDLLDTGVTIMAQPPGKKNATIHLLSGGEKALTAIALVFSIFHLNPAPFCMLDEVDAPLDDVNTGRYAQMVKEMSEKVQFIYITHNKISMEIANQLMGVTMHEPGVSRLVSVDVDEAVQLAQA